MSATGETPPPGWVVIDSALEPLYGSAKPRHYGTLIRYRQGGPDPLDGISAYFNPAPVPHWHLVSYGLTELAEKESANPKVSGFGFELTLRVGNARADQEPPLWTLGLLQSLARYVYTTGRYFEEGHFFELGEPPAPELEGFSTVAFRKDPQLPTSRGPFGAFEFLQVVLLHREEATALKAWNTVGLLEVMAKQDPMLILSPARPRVLAVPELAKEIAERTAKEGSSTPRLRLSHAGWQRSPWGPEVELTLGADAAPELGAVLPGRLGFDRPLEVLSAEGETPVVTFLPGQANGVQPSGGMLRVTLTKETARKLGAELTRGKGPWRLPELAELVVQPRQVTK